MARRQQEIFEVVNSQLRSLGLTVLGLWGGYNELFNREEIRWPAVGIIGLFLGLPVANLLDGLIKAARTNGAGGTASTPTPPPSTGTEVTK